VAAGAFANGGRQALAAGKGGERLASVAVEAGDVVELVVLPKADHSCDTTVVDLTISTASGDKTWNAAADLLDDVHSGNPHTDRYGNAEIWSLADTGDRKRGTDATGGEFAAWTRLPADARKRAAAEFQRTFRRTDAGSPFWITAVEQESVLPEPARAELAALRKELDAARKIASAPLAFANAAQEGGVPGSPHAGTHDVRVHVRGRYDRLGDLVPRRFPEVISGTVQPQISQGSGRRELADWLTRPDHPLTARVMANRVWQYHFGEGIVRTPSNFGKLGERPTNPELLDWLADRLVRGGWSLKSLHREIMLSATYRQSSVPPTDTLRHDPDNRLFGWMNRRRLEAEPLRDSLLAASGRLDRTAGGTADRDFSSPRRTLYQITVRSDRSGFGPLFDVADPTAPVDKRTISTVAPQALFLLNHPFVVNNVRALSERVVRSSTDDAGRIRRAYELLFGRPPTPDEERVGQAFLQSQPRESSWFAYCQVLLCANEFTYVD
jgi:hypothetical protein